jgi:hypothetical protein
MLAPIDPAIKEKIITAFLTGHGVNRITRDLHQQGVKVSHGSVSNIVRKFKHEKSQQRQSPPSSQLQLLQPKETQPQQQHQNQANTPTNNAYTADTNIRDLTAVGSAFLNTTEASSPHTSEASSPPNGGGLAKPVCDSKTKTSGNPLSFFIALESTTVRSDATTVVPESADDGAIVASGQVNINNDLNYLNNHVAKNTALEKEFEGQECPDQGKAKISIATHPSRQTIDSEIEDPAPLTSTIDSEQTVESSNFEINWDSDENWHRRFWARTLQEKKERKRELLLIQQERQQMQYQLEEERQQLAQLRQNLDRRQHDIEVKEAKLVEIQQLAPFVKELQAYGITFDLILPYLMAINEKSVLQNMNQKDAAREIAQYLRAYRNLESLQKAVEKAERQLKGLDAFSAINNQAITTMINLKLAGYSEKHIMDLARWSKYHQLGSPGLTQGNGSSQHHDDGDTGNGSKWKLDDKLNISQNN